MADERIVQFWRIQHRDGSDLPWAFPATQVVQKLRGAANSNLNRYRVARDGAVVLGEGLAHSPAGHIVLYRTRRTNLPHVDVNGVVTDLDLPRGGALAEPTHFVFHPRNIVSVLFNNNGPRAGRFVDYLNAKLGCEINLVPIYREDLAEVLEEMRQTRVEVTLPATQALQLSQAPGDDWATPLANAANLLHDGYLTLRVSVGRSGTAQEREGRVQQIKQLVGQLLGRNDLGAFRSIKVQGTELDTSNPVTVDLLEQRFILRAEVPAGPNGVDPSDARRVLMAQYQQNLAFLQGATPPVNGAAPAGTVGEFVPLPEDEKDNAGQQ